MLLPENPAERRVLLVLDATSYTELGGTDLAQLQRNNDVHVVNLAEATVATDDTLAADLIDQGLLAAGRVLIQSPFDPGAYADANEAVTTFALEKATTFALLCQYLGATSVRINHLEDVAETMSRSGRAEGEHVTGTASGGGGSETSSLEKRVLALADTYSGSRPSVEKARSLLERRRLTHDPVLMALLESFEFTDNPMWERSLSLSLTQEANRRIEAWLAVNVKAGPVRSALSGKYDSLGKHRREVEASYSLVFRDEAG
ncbi:hypothetical protein K1X13_14065 [Nocardioides sp. WL0053]|uniref:Uncharacterized protein n=1 Tax=Nocardioides jiangsuensis TaxID=2866161 RepID=A0ABS7RPW2_9ACTN|nr:hypothetical protein [Nocardioides jiangsuensis]MBY9075955.1 hypothetical protein [Nocardioides jiangsuensis]